MPRASAVRVKTGSGPAGVEDVSARRSLRSKKPVQYKPSMNLCANSDDDDGDSGSLADFSRPATDDEDTSLTSTSSSHSDSKQKPKSAEKRSATVAEDGAIHPLAKRARAAAAESQSRGASVRAHSGWKTTDGLNLHLPPINDIASIFADMTERALGLGLRSALEHLGTRKLNVATMCSGTESPMLALEMICDHLASSGHQLRINHVFSAEIEPFKQAYIERNFRPKILFRDIEEIAYVDQASTAYGAPTSVPPPGSVDLLVAGFACVDYSNLNNKKKISIEKNFAKKGTTKKKGCKASAIPQGCEASVDQKSSPDGEGTGSKKASGETKDVVDLEAQEAKETGESSATFQFIVDYIDKYRPPVIILENVVGAPWTYVCDKLRSKAYLPLHHKLDTKKYYLPHTRQRIYLIAVDVKDLKTKELECAQDAKNKWLELMGKLERPASSPVEAFLLDELDPRLHRARVAISRGQDEDEYAQRDVEWSKCQGRHLKTRNDDHLGSGRPVTEWIENGPSRMVDYGDAVWTKRQVPRVKDTLDISFLRAARRGYDDGYKPRFPDLSQNVDRNSDNAPWGITGCITPMGIPYSTFRGGPLVGLEALAMQGLPIDRLYLTRESQRNLQDLAGNAMTSTVVGAAILSALVSCHMFIKTSDSVGLVDSAPTVRRLKKPAETPVGGQDEELSSELSAEQLQKRIEQQFRKKDKEQLHAKALNFGPSQVVPVSVLQAVASNSVRRCLCEGQFSNTTRIIYKCKKCAHTVCQKCRGIPKHSYVELGAEESASRAPPQAFVSLIKKALPTELTIANLSWSSFEAAYDEQHPISGDRDLYQTALQPAFDDQFRFHSVIRSEIWSIWYEASHARLELRFCGGIFRWKLYVKPAASEPANARIRQLLKQPIAHMIVEGESLLDGSWKLCLPKTTSLPIDISGRGSLVSSWKSRLGLDDFTTERVWSRLHISIKDDSNIGQRDLNIAGEYRLHADCGTASGALHQKFTDGKPENFFLFLDPERQGAPDNDEFVFSSDIRRMNYQEHRHIEARIGKAYSAAKSWLDLHKCGNAAMKKWRPRAEEKQTAVCTVYGSWVPCAAFIRPSVDETTALSAAVNDFDPSLNNTIPATGSSQLIERRCADAVRPILACTVPNTHFVGKEWKKERWIRIDHVNERQMFSSIAWLTERSTNLDGFSSGWRPLNLPKMHARCEECAPRRPSILWELDHKNKMSPFEHPAHTGPYERAMKTKPSPLDVFVRWNDNHDLDLLINVNIQALAHRAAARLLDADSSEMVNLTWRLETQYQFGELPTLPRFTLPNNKHDIPMPHTFPGKPKSSAPYALRIEQQRSLRWMVNREAPNVIPFIEQASEEFCLPSLGWRIEARASRARTIRGGVLADEVGYGKTITTLALIDRQRVQAKVDANCSRPGKISVRATLIVASQTLVLQWQDEAEKFLGSKYTVKLIKNIAELKSLRVSEVLSADIVIVSSSIFHHQIYLKRLSQFAAMPEVPTRPPLRALDAWMSRALDRVRLHTDELAANPMPAQFGKTLHERLKQAATDDDLLEQVPSQIPSKRLRGSEFLKARKRRREAARAAATAKAREEKKADARKKAIEEGLDESGGTSDDEQESDNSPGKSAKVARASKASHQSSTASLGYDASDTDPFKLDKAQGLDQLMGPVLQMFHWDRVVIDEYASEKEQTFAVAMKSLESTKRWILSGTPALGDVADIKFMASFFDVNLGEIDDAAGALKGRNARMVGADRTPTEKFEACQKHRSAKLADEFALYAQNFLNHFIRQNTAEIDEIKAVTHLLPIWLETAHQAIYLECKMQLLAQEMTLRKGNRSSLHNDRTRRQKALFKTSKSAEEALMKRCSHFQLDDTDQQPDDAESACLMIIEERKREIEELYSALEKQLSFSKALKYVCGDKDVHYSTWLLHVDGGNYGDAEATSQLKNFIRNVVPYKGRFSEIDWTLKPPALKEHKMRGSSNVMQAKFIKNKPAPRRKKVTPETDDSEDKFQDDSQDCSLDESQDESVNDSQEDYKPQSTRRTRVSEKEERPQYVVRKTNKAAGKKPTSKARTVRSCSEQREEGQAHKPGKRSNPSKRKRPDSRTDDYGDDTGTRAVKRNKTTPATKVFEQSDKQQRTDDKESNIAVKTQEKDKTKSAKGKVSTSARVEDEETKNFEPEIQLRRVKEELHKMAVELALRTRALRFITNVRKVQLWQAEQQSNPGLNFTTDCAHETTLSDQLYVLGQCGHTSCRICLVSRSNKTKCLMEGCRAPALDYHLISATDFHPRHTQTPQNNNGQRGSASVDTSKRRVNGPKEAVSYGAKIAEIVRILQEIEAKSEQALLFVQFDDLMSTLSGAFDHYGISHFKVDQKAAARSTGKDSGSTMLKEFKDLKRERRTVLMLNSGDASAAGHNLTNANHVLFVSPLFTASRYEYDATYAQAIGRARRYGQNKIVHVYHFLALKTVDIDILEKRNPEKKAVFRQSGDAFELVTTTGLREDEKTQQWASEGFEATDLRDDSDSED